MQEAELKIKPLHDNIVVKADPVEEKTAGGIIIPDNVREKPARGKVVAVGSGAKGEPMELKVGDNVMYSKYVGKDIIFEGQEYIIMKESDVLATV